MEYSLIAGGAALLGIGIWGLCEHGVALTGRLETDDPATTRYLSESRRMAWGYVVVIVLGALSWGIA